MFGHLKAEEFINTIEGAALSRERRAHLDSCSFCTDRLKSIRTIRDSIAMQDSGIPEPDWNDFRESVRQGLLSRSVKRESVVRRWTGWPIRPAMAWAVSFAVLIFVSAGGFLWHFSTHTVQEPQSVTPPASPTASDTVDIETEVAAWGRSGVFEDLATIQGGHAEQVRKLLQAAAQEGKVERR